MSNKYWNKKLKCWWDNRAWVVEENGKIYSAYYRDGEVYGLDITEYIEVKDEH